MSKIRTPLLLGLLCGAAALVTFTATVDADELNQPADNYMHYDCIMNQQVMASYMLTPETDANATLEDRQEFCSMAAFGVPDEGPNWWIDVADVDPFMACGQLHYQLLISEPIFDEGHEHLRTETLACRTETQAFQNQQGVSCAADFETEQCFSVAVSFGADDEEDDEGPEEGGEEEGGEGGCTSDQDCGLDEHCHENQGEHGTCAPNGTIVAF